MSNQIVISSGAKVRNLSGVLTGTSGIVDSLGINVPNGVPQLDGSGKILVSQLPNSVMEYKGSWNAATNTPTLANGTGNAGDVYLCEVAGTVNFGAGPIEFFVGDQVVYSGSIWQRASGATGTVSSVAVTESGDAITITGSPITTSGTINIGFAGTSGQYVNGAGGLTTFPTLLSSVGLSMPSAFTVTNSPLTANGTISVTGAGTTAQYVRGDGSLATFPSTSQESKRLITEVYNSTGATLTKGTIVYINGGQGNLPTVTKAIATGDSTSAQTYGVVQSDITNNNNGFVVVIGSLTDLDTQTYAAGTQLYLSGTTAGTWTSTKPSAPVHLVYVGIVVRSHPTQGVVEIKIQNGYELDELHDVAISSVANNDGIFYNSSNDLWENKTIAGALGYTPANDSLVVKLAGTQTITGLKTFGVGFQLPSAGSGNQSSYFVNTSSIHSGSAGSNGFGFNNSNNIYFGKGSSNGGVLAWNNTAIRSYNLPDTSGTIALTSDIPSLSGYIQGSGTTNYIPKFTASGTIGNSAIVDNASYVDVRKPFQVSSSAGTGALMAITSNAADTVEFRAINSSGGNKELFYFGSTISFYTGALDVNSTTERMTITPTGNVGIGTTSPSSKLEISGDLTINNGSADGGQLVLASSGYSNWSIDNYSGSLRAYYGSSVALSIASNLAATFSSSVTALGTTIRNPSTDGSIPLIEIRDNSNTYQIGYLNFNQSTDMMTLMNKQGYSASGIAFGTNNIERMRISQSGNVGIGTSSPTAFSGNTVLAINNAAGGAVLELQSNGTSAFRMATSSADSALWEPRNVPVLFATNNTERMRITSGGNLLVGTTTDGVADARLNVAGSIITRSYGGSGSFTTSIPIPSGFGGLFVAKGYNTTNGVSFSVIYNVATRVPGGGGSDVYYILVSQNGVSTTFTFDNNGGFLRINPSANTQWSGTFLGL